MLDVNPNILCINLAWGSHDPLVYSSVSQPEVMQGEHSRALREKGHLKDPNKHRRP